LVKKRPRSRASGSSDRLTVSLARGQRAALDQIARRNNAALGFVVRYALSRFIETSRRDQQLELDLAPGREGRRRTGANG
jgi:hypothetical protein